MSCATSRKKRTLTSSEWMKQHMEEKRLEQLYQLSMTLGTTLDLAHETATFVNWLKEAVQPTLAALFVTDEAKQELRLVEAYGFTPPADPCLPLGLDLWRWLEEQGASVPAEGDPRRYAVPIPIEKQLFGTLCLISSRPTDQLADEQRLVIAAVNYLAPVLRNIWRYQTLEQQVAKRTAALEALNTIAITLSQSLELDETGAAALEATLEVTGFEVGGIALWDESEGRLRPVATQDVGPDLMAVLSGVPRAGGLRELTLNTGQPVFIDDTAHDPRVNPQIAQQGFTISAMVPLICKGTVLGIMAVTTRSPRQWTEDEKSLLTAVGHQIGIAIENARLYQQLAEYARSLEARVAERTAEIRAEKERSDTILRSIQDAIIITDPQGTIVFVNAGFERLTGYSQAEVVGRNPRFLQSGETPPELYEGMWATITQGKTWRGTLRNRRKDGSVYDADLTIAPVLDESGRIVNYVGSERDITALMELDRLKSQFVSNVSHELRTPLANIKLYQSMLRAGMRPDKTEQYWEGDGAAGAPGGEPPQPLPPGGRPGDSQPGAVGLE